MKITFTGQFTELKDKLENTKGVWDDSQPNKKVMRLNGGILNWYESTGTIQFQGSDPGKTTLENIVKNTLYPDQFQAITETKEPQKNEESTFYTTHAHSTIEEDYLSGKFESSEIIIGIVSAVGTETSRVVTTLIDRLNHFGYKTEEVKVSSLLTQGAQVGEFSRIKDLMEKGDQLRKNNNNNAILAYGVAKTISEKRKLEITKRAFIINSLKHPDEVETLRKIYGQGFYLLGIHSDKKRRLQYLTDDKGLTSIEANELTEIDEDEKIPHGQRTRDTYHLADFFINFGKIDEQVKNTIQRFLELIFSHPYKNPTFDEFAMFMAFSSSVRSGDLSRQVGAVISKRQQIIATGANECPSFGGGLYWAEVNASGEVVDKVDGKDYTRNEDSNRAEQAEIIDGIMKNIENEINDQSEKIKIKAILEKSRIRDLTEFGRVVHAEMEAILSCSREGISCIDATLYCTTFPCHNCAKHIIAAGIKRVVYVEPYPKSKALEFHSDSIELNLDLDNEKKHDHLVVEPFTGVGARRFLDFFSMNLGLGNKLKRKDQHGNTVDWTKGTSSIRVPLLPKSYIEIENTAAKIFSEKK